MLKSAQLGADRAEPGEGARTPAPISAELERREVALRVEGVHLRMRAERRAKFYGDLSCYWPLALGLGLGFYAPWLRDVAAAGFGPWAVKLLFSLSALAALGDVRLGADSMPNLSQTLLYLQFPVDGMLASMLLRKRSSLLGMCAQVAVFHMVVVLAIGLASGSLSGVLNEMGRFLEVSH